MNFNDGRFWFVRSNGGNGSYPVTLEGWAVVLAFVLGVMATAVTAYAVQVVVPETPWLGFAVFGVGMAADATAFILIARSKTDWSITASDYFSGKGTR